MRTIVVGDIHGCLDELNELMKQVSYVKGTDRLVLLGDLIDRGPDSPGVVRRARELGAEVVMGNHEEKALRWRRHETKRKVDPVSYKNPMTVLNEARLKEWAAVRDEDWEWLAACPPFIHINSHWTAVHGGCMPGVEIEKQEPNKLMRMRYIDLDKMKMSSLNEKGEAPPNSVHWTTQWTGPRSIVYGHYTRPDTLLTDFHPPAWTLGLDSGCVHGLLLSAAIFTDDLKGYQLSKVKAKATYAEIRTWDQE